MFTRSTIAVSTISIVVLSAVIALNCVLQIHKKFDRIPPGRDLGILEHHMRETLLTWG